MRLPTAIGRARRSAPAARQAGHDRGGTLLTTAATPIRLCFICWGNICRSPTAEGIMRALVDGAGLGDRITVDSAGTSTDELGKPVDPRAVKEAARRGIALEHVAWQFQPEDFDRYDMVLVADHVNMSRMRRLVRDDDDAAKLHLLRAFDPDADEQDTDVPDPWYGGQDGFVHVYDLMEAACRGLLEQLR